MTPSKLIRKILLPLFPQKDKVEESIMPIYTNFSFPTDWDTRRVVIYSGTTASPELMLGDRDMIRGVSAEIVVASPSDDEAYSTCDTIIRYLRSYKDGEVIQIIPVSDIEPLGINAKKLMIYSARFTIIK